MYLMSLHTQIKIKIKDFQNILLDRPFSVEFSIILTMHISPYKGEIGLIHSI